jgi:hypothetical protein
MYDRDAIIANVDLTALADELLGGRRGTARSPAWPCPNPRHAQTGRTPPVSIFTSRRGEQRWRCHGCGTGGTAIDLVMTCCRTDARHAMDQLARRVGLDDQGPTWSPPPTRSRPTAIASRQGCSDPAGMDRYVDECAAALFTPAGQRIRSWLTETRRLPDDVLRTNRIGADLGPRRQPRPDGMPGASGVVLPIVTGADHRAIYAQLRMTNPQPDGPRYLNPTGNLASNPRIGYFRPADQRHREVIVTEGVIDALSATAAGYRAAAVPDQAIAHELSRLPEPLVIAFDQDDAGRAAADRLTALLDAEQRYPVNLRVPANDLNDAMVHSSRWPKELELRVGSCLTQRAGTARSIG